MKLSSACLPPVATGSPCANSRASNSSSQSRRDRAEDLRLDDLRLVHQEVGHERELALPVDHRVRERKRAASRCDVEDRVVGADRVHRVRDDAGRHLVADEVALDVGAVGELVQAGVVAVDRAPELGIEARAVAQVVAIGEHDALRRRHPVGAEHPESLLRHHRIEQGPGLGQEIGAHALLDSRMLRGPVKDAGAGSRWPPRALLASAQPDGRSALRPQAPLQRQGPRDVRDRRRPADGRLGSDLRLRRRDGRPDPRQGPGPDPDVGLLVRDDGRDRAQPLHLPGGPRARSPAARCGSSGSRCTRSSASSAATSSGSGWREYRDSGAVCGIELPDGPARVRPPARADLHPRDQGRDRRARREHRLRPRLRDHRLSAADGGAAPRFDRALRARRRPRGRSAGSSSPTRSSSSAPPPAPRSCSATRS